MKKYSYIIIIMAIFAACKKEKLVDKSMTLPFFNSASFTPEWISEDAASYSGIHTIPDFTFTNQNGETITNNNYKDKIYIFCDLSRHLPEAD